MDNDIIIFGNTQFSQMLKFYIENDTDYKVKGFTVDKKYKEGGGIFVVYH